jgi:hypothetical protein
MQMAYPFRELDTHLVLRPGATGRPRFGLEDVAERNDQGARDPETPIVALRGASAFQIPGP